MRRSEDALLRSACADLLGDAGPSSLLERLIEAFGEKVLGKEDFSFQVGVCQAYHQSMLLWTVPVMLDIYLRSTVRTETGAIRIFLSRLLEPEFGEIADATIPDGEYRDLVLDAYEATREQFGTDRVPVLYGQLFSVRELAERLYDNVVRAEGDSIAILRQRHFFEAATGTDCSGFYQDEELQPLNAAAILEDFLENKEPDKYEPGIRYFFGHRIPD
jgi:hypothetical protein